VVVGDSGTSTTRSRTVAVSDSGRGFAAWTDDARLWLMPVDLGSGLGEPTAIDSGDDWVEDGVSLAVNGAGQAIMAWVLEKRFSGTPELIAAVYEPDTGWGEPVSLNSPFWGGGAPVAIDEAGNAVVLHGNAEGWMATSHSTAAGWTRPNLYAPAAVEGRSHAGGTMAISDGAVFVVWIETLEDESEHMLGAYAELTP
jgi:hypothetical protein